MKGEEMKKKGEYASWAAFVDGANSGVVAPVQQAYCNLFSMAGEKWVGASRTSPTQLWWNARSLLIGLNEPTSHFSEEVDSFELPSILQIKTHFFTITTTTTL